MKKQSKIKRQQNKIKTERLTSAQAVSFERYAKSSVKDSALGQGRIQILDKCLDDDEKVCFANAKFKKQRTRIQKVASSQVLLLLCQVDDECSESRLNGYSTKQKAVKPRLSY